MEEALGHEFFASIRDKKSEKEATFKLDFAFEGVRNEHESMPADIAKMSAEERKAEEIRKQQELEQLKKLIYDEMKTYHPTFDENDPATFHTPKLSDKEVYTLDTDGRFFYCGTPVPCGCGLMVRVCRLLQICVHSTE